MFRKILVAVDRSATSNHVFEEAVALAKGTGASLMLLHVLSPDEKGYPEAPFLSSMEYYPRLHNSIVQVYMKRLETFQEESLNWLRSLADEATVAGVKTEFTQTSGNPGYAICELAETWEADLIIMGRRGLSGLSEFLIGSVSNYVTHHAKCSVLTIHHPVKSNTKVIAANQEALASKN